MTDIHQRVSELLPWFVNGTLSAREREFVQTHINDCIPCRRAMLEEESIFGAVRELRAPDAEEHGLDRLLRSIDARTRKSAKTSRAVRRPHQGLGVRVLSVSVAAAVLTIVVAVTILSNREAAGPEEPVASERDFSTLTTREADTSSRIDVIFAEDTSIAEIDALVSRIQARVVSGPSPIGRYTLSLKPGSDMESVLEDLRNDTRIRFAAQTFIAEESD